MSGPASNDGARVAESLATSVLLRVPALTDDLVHTIQEQNQGYRRMNVVPRDDLWRSCHDNVTRVLQLLAGLDSEDGADVYYDAAQATGQRRAQQQLPLDDVLRSFRLGGRLVWQYLIDEARAASTVGTDGLLDVATRVWEVVDTISSQVAAAYHAAERQLVRADEQRRAALWEGLLQGRATDAAFAYEASRIVRLPVDGPYAVVSAGGRQDNDGLTDALGERLEERGIRSAWQARSATLVGLLALPLSATDAAVKVLRGILTGPVGVSLVVTGLAEVDQAYRQATLARRTLPAGGRAIVSLSERLPEALLLNSPELTEPLVRRWLGPLLDLPAHDRRMLLHTLETWASTAGSTIRTAEALHCHRNTVINRMHRIESVIGLEFSSENIPVELTLALRALPFLNDHPAPVRKPEPAPRTVHNAQRR
ncbi:PucR family transcriptional regulator [Amycolatopsis sp. H20-H5]|uniref:PucR family transcriptional regulator n=1 Tax=Amycolatopsis sp. H20-H5 TaxID=3046309 RepID=UPI002DB5CC91|nr:helix-turn-helix domain-containing protein [Amycolatopsis sp. H20-H5]MEC3976173.1 helix-turn-helix domain-containing protein [Amycolatopsis sp. H20-H5]